MDSDKIKDIVNSITTNDGRFNVQEAIQQITENPNIVQEVLQECPEMQFQVQEIVRRSMMQSNWNSQSSGKGQRARKGEKRGKMRRRARQARKIMNSGSSPSFQNHIPGNCMQILIITATRKIKTQTILKEAVFNEAQKIVGATSSSGLAAYQCPELSCGPWRDYDVHIICQKTLQGKVAGNRRATRLLNNPISSNVIIFVPDTSLKMDDFIQVEKTLLAVPRDQRNSEIIEIRPERREFGQDSLTPGPSDQLDIDDIEADYIEAEEAAEGAKGEEEAEAGEIDQELEDLIQKVKASHNQENVERDS